MEEELTGLGTESWSSGRNRGDGTPAWATDCVARGTSGQGWRGAAACGGARLSPGPLETVCVTPSRSRPASPWGKVAEGRRGGWYSPPCPGRPCLRVLPAKQNKCHSSHVSAKTTAGGPAPPGPQTGIFWSACAEDTKKRSRVGTGPPVPGRLSRGGPQEGPGDSSCRPCLGAGSPSSRLPGRNGHQHTGVSPPRPQPWLPHPLAL